MREAWTLTRKELHSYFDSPVAYVVLSIFLIMTGWFFSTNVFLENTASLRSMFDIVPFIFLFFIPAITMSTFAEERRSGTLELLLTLPVRDWQVILGKLMAVTIFLMAAIGMTLVYTVAVASLGDLDFGATFGGYLGLFLLGMTCASIGIMASSFTKNQVVAFILSFGLIFTLYLMDKVTAFIPTWMSGVVQFLGTDFHYQNLLRGVVDTRDVVYYLSMTVFAGLLTMYSLAKRPE
ncbi:MAG: ABC-2 type transport system permease protein [Rhodothermales bacterium]|jgi:ABC-2 type transport system permease protein